MFSLRFLLFLVLLSHASKAAGQPIYEVEQGNISFNSDAPNEFIKASSGKLRGVIDVGKKQFVFKVDVTSFEGFNSPLQKEHFNENYMESTIYPDIVFSGKIIEDADLTQKGQYTIRAKGKLNVHGVSADRIIYADVTVKDHTVQVVSNFKVALADHDIKIPRIVNDKLSTEIFIAVKMTLAK